MIVLNMKPNLFYLSLWFGESSNTILSGERKHSECISTSVNRAQKNNSKKFSLIFPIMEEEETNDLVVLK